jgi:hypothetical protein
MNCKAFGRKESWFNSCNVPLAQSVQRLATGWKAEGGRSLSTGEILFSTLCRPVLGPTQPPIQRVRVALSPRVKRTGREADHLPSTIIEVKNMWIYTSILHTPSCCSA